MNNNAYENLVDTSIIPEIDLKTRNKEELR